MPPPRSDPSTPTSAFDPDRQVSQLTVVDRAGHCARVIFETTSHIEAPNWSPDGAWLLCNGGGRLFKIRLDGSGPLQEIPTTSGRFANNDHVLSPDGHTIYFTVRGGELYSVPWEGGEARRISNVHPPDSPLRCYLHGVSPNGRTLVYVGLAGVGKTDHWGIYTIAAEGGADECLLKATVPLDGPEYSPDAGLLPGLPPGTPPTGASSARPRIWAADIQMTPNGRFLYATERTTSKIALLRVAGESGRLTYVTNCSTETQPRSIRIDPSGKFLVASGQKSDRIAVFRIDQENGALSLVGRYPVGRDANWVEIVSFPQVGWRALEG